LLLCAARREDGALLFTWKKGHVALKHI
jgi:hypothetical protein